MHPQQYEIKRGYISLLMVLVIFITGSSLAVTLLMLGTNFTQNTQNKYNLMKARAMANACAEAGLQRIRDNNATNVSGNLTENQVNCTYSITTSGSGREIRSTAQAGRAISKVRVVLDTINPQINITSWQEISDF